MASQQKTQATATAAREKTLALVGNPNVGKSVMFSNLTGTYVTVSNYPGTTVEVSRGRAEIGGDRYEVVDTPGMYSLLPLSEDERVARDILLREKPDVVLHVVDARNLPRMLGLTMQLIEAGQPVVLGLNMMDEARDRGLSIDVEALAEELGIPVVPLVATTGEGMNELRRTLEGVGEPGDTAPVRYSSAQGVDIEGTLEDVQNHLSADYAMSDRAMAALLLQGDDGAEEWVRENEGEAYEDIEALTSPARDRTRQPLDYLLKVQRRRRADDICSRVISREATGGEPFTEKLSRVLVRPITGIPILLAVLYFALYRFVGVFGAGTAVDFLEGVVFGEWLNPYVESAVQGVIPWPVLQSLFVGDYGIITLGLRYAIAIILPVVTFFFLVFSLIEDVGYLPRLALLLDRAFKKIGLSGRAVIPMVLGFGCDTMATMVTRTLTSKRERLISVILLSAAVPCSAQLGVIMALLSGVPGAMAAWAFIILGVYVAIGTLASSMMPGEADSFYVEIPPLRLPKLSNVLTKTFARVRWYLKEVLPLFILASVIIWLGQLTGVFGATLSVLEYPVSWVGLPPDAAEAFLFGFFRRDYGVAGLYDLNQTGALSGNQLLVGAVALTLFLPCIAQFLVTAREQGWKTGLAIGAAMICVSFGVAFLVYEFLALTGVAL